MIRSPLIILAVTIFSAGISICYADDPGAISQAQFHAMMVNQELDRIEPSGNNQAAIPSPVGNEQITVSPSVAAPAFYAAVVPRKNEFDLSRELYWAKYDEPKNMYQKGFMSGFNAQFSHRISTGPNSIINMFRLQGQWASGKFKTQPPDQGPSGIKDNTFDVRGVVGKDFYPASNVRATGYFGFGYRYLENDPEGLNTVVDDFTLLGYKTYSHYYYLPLGMDFIYQANPNYNVESNLEYDYVLDGWQVDKLGVVPGYNTLVFDQGSGNGLRASVRLNVYFKYCTGFIEGFYRYWNIAKSNSKADPTDPSVSLSEPRNNTQEFGFRLGLQI